MKEQNKFKEKTDTLIETIEDQLRELEKYVNAEKEHIQSENKSEKKNKHIAN